jgi:predicted ATP-dependent endonuclease of OLD family
MSLTPSVWTSRYRRWPIAAVFPFIHTWAMFSIQRLELHGFKAFERFTLRLKGDGYLAGPNNAGKSTLTSALRISAQMVRIATRRGPTDNFMDGTEQVLGYAFTNGQVGLTDGNLRHEFRDLDTRIVAGFDGQATLKAVWPGELSGEPPFFYLQQGRSSINNVRQAREAFPDIGVVPVLAPVDTDEESLTPKYVRENLDGRLASRHFRNQLGLLRDEAPGEDLDAFLSFATPWIPEMKIKTLTEHMGEKNFILDLYYTDTGRKAEKEIAWAGDGMQIWLQLLLHIFRLRDRDVIVLDEPDVFLHPDLQRRLVRLLDSLEGQTITATHSAEVLAEALPESVLWVDKSRRRSVAAPEPAASADLNSALGSLFNIRLARALRARCILFVEGDDGKVLRQLASTIGAARVATETGIAVIPLRGFDNWEHVEPFSWMSTGLLDDSVKVFALLDRDYRADDQCKEVRSRLQAVRVSCHVWKRKELESYLLDSRVVARVTGADEEWVEEALALAAEESEDDVFGQVLAETSKSFPRNQASQAAKEGRKRFEELWQERNHRKWVAPPERVLHGLNRRLSQAGHKTTSFRKLARQFDADDIPDEMISFLDRVEDALEDAGVPSVVR